MEKSNFMGTNISAFKKLDSRSVIVIGYRAFESKSGNECYVLDIVSKHKIESTFVDVNVFLNVHENGCGEYNVFRDDRGRIEDVDFIGTLEDSLAN